MGLPVGEREDNILEARLVSARISAQFATECFERAFQRIQTDEIE